jgi:hypothetical protein
MAVPYLSLEMTEAAWLTENVSSQCDCKDRGTGMQAHPTAY